MIKVCSTRKQLLPLLLYNVVPVEVTAVLGWVIGYTAADGLCRHAARLPLACLQQAIKVPLESFCCCCSLPAVPLPCCVLGLGQLPPTAHSSSQCDYSRKNTGRTEEPQEHAAGLHTLSCCVLRCTGLAACIPPRQCC